MLQFCESFTLHHAVLDPFLMTKKSLGKSDAAKKIT